MNVSVEEINACRKRLRIEVPPNEVNAEIQRITQEFQQIAKIPGFRPGKAPKDVIAKRYEKEIDDEVQRALVPKAYRKAVKDKKLRVVSPPAIEDMKFQRGLSLSFSTIIDLAPDIRLPNYKGIPISAAPTEVTDEEYQKTINMLRDQQAEFANITDRVIQTGDYAVINYTANVDGKPLTEIAPAAKNLGEQKNLWVLVETDSYLPKFGEQLVGQKIEETREIIIEFPSDFPHSELVGKKAIFLVTLKEIKEKKLPPLDDAFCQKIAGVTLAEFEKTVKERLQSQKKNDAVSQQKNKIVEYLTSKTDFDLPESVLNHQTRNVIREIVEQNQKRGIDAETLESKKDEIFQTASKGAKDRVKTSFLLLKIAEEEKLEVSETEFNAHIQRLGYRYGMAPKKLIEELEKNNALGQIEEEILLNKTLDFLLTQAKVETI